MIIKATRTNESWSMLLFLGAMSATIGLVLWLLAYHLTLPVWLPWVLLGGALAATLLTFLRMYIAASVLKAAGVRPLLRTYYYCSIAISFAIYALLAPQLKMENAADWIVLVAVCAELYVLGSVLVISLALFVFRIRQLFQEYPTASPWVKALMWSTLGAALLGIVLLVLDGFNGSQLKVAGWIAVAVAVAGGMTIGCLTTGSFVRKSEPRDSETN